MFTTNFEKSEKKVCRGDFFLQQNTKNHIYFLKKIGGVFSYVFIVWLFFKNNIRFNKILLEMSIKELSKREYLSIILMNL